MTHEREIESLLDQWFGDGPSTAPDRVIDIVAERIERQSQRHVWRLPRKDTHVRTIYAFAGAAAVIVAAVLTFNLVQPTSPIQPAETPSVAPSIVASPSPTARPTRASSPSPLSGDGLVVFEHYTPGRTTRLEYLIPDGRGQELLPDIPGTQEMPSWSPDGAHLAFAAHPDDGTSQELIWETDATGATPRLITTDCQPPDCLDENSPAYSPDGGRMAFVRSAGPRGGPPSSSVVAIRDLASGAVSELESTRVTYPGGFVDRPRWSPDGARLVFDKVLVDPSEMPIDSSVVLVGLDGGALLPLTEPGFWAGDADWSPDGSLIAFARQPIRHWNAAGRAVGENQWIYTIAPDGTKLTQLTTGLTGAPSWTSGGSQILYNVREASETGIFGEFGFFVMNLDGSDPTAVAGFSNCCRWYPVQQPTP